MKTTQPICPSDQPAYKALTKAMNNIHAQNWAKLDTTMMAETINKLVKIRQTYFDIACPIWERDLKIWANN